MDTKQDAQATAPAEPSTITVPVMDVQRPRQFVSVQDQPAVTSAPVMETFGAPTSEESETAFIESPVLAADQAPEVSPVPPEEEEPVGNELAPISNETGSVPAAVEPSVDQTVPAPYAEPPADSTPPHSATAPAQEPEHHKGPIGAVIAAVVIAVLLAGLTVFAYLQSKDSKTASNKSAQTTKMSGKDVDATSSQIDSSIQSASDATDFGATDLSDSALGL